MSQELKPCPFCGSPADVQDQFGREFWPQCTNLDCGATDGKLYESPGMAAQAWNTRAQAPAAEPLEAVVSAYRVGDGIGAIKVERVMQIAGADLWAVRRYAEVLSKQGAWEWEPLPSSRDDDFLARCRFATSDEAIAAALAAAKEQQP